MIPNEMKPAIVVAGLDFSYPQTTTPIFSGLDLTIPTGSRCLLLGQNGVGKSTLMRVLGGKHMVPAEAVRVLGSAAFHDTSLCQRVALLHGPFPFDVDLGVDEILAQRCAPRPDVGVSGPLLRAREERRDRLVEVLEIDPRWRMHRLSSGQRRRVQVLLALLSPVELVLLDEVTADLDVLSRSDLMEFLRVESAARGATILYATHVLDGLLGWATHLCFLSPGPRGSVVRVMAPIDQVPELQELLRRGVTSPLLALCERWLREDRLSAAGRPGRGSGR